MVKVVANREHLHEVLTEALGTCRHRLFIATADVKLLQLPAISALGTKDGRSILDVFRAVGEGRAEVCLLHGGVPSGPFLRGLKDNLPPNLKMRRCPRMHAKAVIVDGRRMYLGSANLTGAGLGAKGTRRRNFEAGIWTDQLALIDPVLDMLHSVWDGSECPNCDRKTHCPAPLEEPQL